LKKFKQIFYNLLSNAVKFTPEGGTVEITTDYVGDFEVSGADRFIHRRYAEFCVKDNGIGISKEDQERIFQEFQQLDGSYSRQYEGSGLGLALTKKLIELQGGSIWVESEKGKGSAFYFTLPIAESEAAAMEPAGAPDDHAPALPMENRSGKQTALVVDDDPQSAELLKTYFEEAGYRALTAASGAEAITVAKIHQPSVITLDLILPDKDGWQTLRELKLHPDTADIPVIVISVLQDEDTMRQGASAYLVKPVSKAQLLASLQVVREEKANEPVSNVLIIDSNEGFVKVLSSLLEGHAFSVSQANSGLQGLEAIQNEKPDLIFLDIGLPDISGIELIEFLKMNENMKNIPIIALAERDLTDEEKHILDGKIEAVARKSQSGSYEFLSEINRVGRLIKPRKEVG
jgi:CheY-like chemotaxis protein